MVAVPGPHTYRVVGTKLKRVRRKNSDGEEPQEHEAANSRVLNMRVGCGEREQANTDSSHNTVTESGSTNQKQQGLIKHLSGMCIKDRGTQLIHIVLLIPASVFTREVFAGQVSQ